MTTTAQGGAVPSRPKRALETEKVPQAGSRRRITVGERSEGPWHQSAGSRGPGPWQ